ncbi:hypothetical protein MG293_017287, partial [Ovis ammon polii]
FGAEFWIVDHSVLPDLVCDYLQDVRLNNRQEFVDCCPHWRLLYPSLAYTFHKPYPNQCIATAGECASVYFCMVREQPFWVNFNIRVFLLVQPERCYRTIVCRGYLHLRNGKTQKNSRFTC